MSAHSENELIQVITFKRPDTCPVCDGPRSIEIYDVYGKPINYSLICSLKKTGDPRYKDYIDQKRPIYMMKCKRCGEEFLIYWEDNFPRPLRYQPYLNNILSMYGY